MKNRKTPYLQFAVSRTNEVLKKLSTNLGTAAQCARKIVFSNGNEYKNGFHNLNIFNSNAKEPDLLAPPATVFT
jgi:hypothetical protein